MFSIGKWRVNVFKANHTFEEFEDNHEFQRRLHFREDWVLWRTFSIGKWRVNVFKANHALKEFEDDHEFQRRLHFKGTLENIFDQEMKSECIQSQPHLRRFQRRSWVSEKTSFQRRLGTLENVFDREMKSECIQSQPRLRRVRRRPRVSEKTSFQRYSGEHFQSGNWRVNVFKANHTFVEFKDDHEFQRRLHFREDWVLWRTFSIGEMSECIQSQPRLRGVRRQPRVSVKNHFREDSISEKIGYSGERFRSGKWRVNVFKASHAFEEFEDDHEFQRRLHFREDWVLWRTFLIRKWRVNIFKANHTFEVFEDDH